MALDKLTKIDGGGISTTSNYRVGIITASKFIGPFDGSVGNFSGILTALGANFLGNVTIGGTLTYEDVTNIDSVGIVTARDDIHVGGGVSAVGVGTFSGLDINGNVDISGDLDVDGHTNLDNVSIVGVTTFNGLSTNDVIRVRSADSNGNCVVNILSEGTTGNSRILFSDTAATSGDGWINYSHNDRALTFTTAGTSNERLRITSGGQVNISGDLDVDGHTNLDNVSIAGVTTAAGTLRVGTGHTFHDNGNAQIAGIATVYNQLNIPRYYGSGVPTGQYLSIGTDEMVMYQRWNGSVSNIEFRNHNAFFGHTSNAHDKTLTIQSGAITRFKFIQGNGGSGTYAEFNKAGTGGYVQLYGTGVGNKVLTTDANGVNILKDLDVDGHTNLDNVSIVGVTTFSTSPVVPNGTYYKGVINSGSQQKIVGGYISGSDTLRLGESMYLTMNPERLGLGISDPQRTLHLSSDNTVIALTDTAAATNQKTKYILSDAGVFAVGKLSDDYNTATEHLYIDNDGHVIINRGGNGGTADVNADNFVVKNYESSSPCGISILNADNQNSTLYFGNTSDRKHAEVVWSDAANYFLIGTSNASASIKFRVANQDDALTIDSSGHLLPSTAGAQNLGSASAEWGNVYIADNKRLYVGSGQEASLYHDSNNTYFKGGANAGLMSIEGQGNVELFAYSSVLLRVNAGESAVICNHNSSVDLYYNGGTYTTPKLKTTATGVEVHGEIEASQDYPDIQPTLNFNFAATRQIDPRMTYRRTGTASYIDEFGLVRIVGDNTPRFDHDPVTRECKGILIEDTRSNEVGTSNTAGPTNLGSAAQINTVLGGVTLPTGKVGDVRNLHANSGGSGFRWGNSSGGNANTAYSGSLWIRTVSGSGSVIIDVNDGGSKTLSISTEWQRISTTYTSSQAYHFMDLYFTSGVNVYVWGVQIENHATVSSYIPTPSGSSAARNADLLYIEDLGEPHEWGTDFTSFYNPFEGTMVVEYFNATNTDGAYACTLDDGSGNNRFAISNSNSYQGPASSGGTNQGSLDNGTPIVNDDNRMAHAYKYNDRGLAINGNTATQDNGFTVGTGIKYLWIGCRQGSYDFIKGTISRFMYYPKRLPNSQLTTITS